MATLASGKLSEMFEDFLKSTMDRAGNYVYRTRISQLISTEGKSLVVDFGDLLKYNSDLANRVILEPDSSLASFKIATFETMRSENALYADRVKRELKVRVRGITDLVPLRKVDTSYLDKMLSVSGMVVRTSELRPLMTSAAWVCPSGHLTYEDQDDFALQRPAKCELCGEAKNFELDRKQSRFIDFQVIRVQESPEELPPGQLPQFFDVNVEGDIVNTARPGDRSVLTGILRAVPDYAVAQVRTRLFRSQIDCNHVEVRGKEPENVQVTKEDEVLIRSVAAEPDAYARLIASVAPVILGHEPEKEAILLLLAGGSATPLPDGTKLRGDLNILLVGDPGCLVGDERIALGNGEIVKMEQIGKSHLQDLNLQVLTGQGGGKRDWATRFHIYRRQPILEAVTESGKSVKGTYNHPMLVLKNDEGRLLREWRRLDELKVGDRLVATTFIPCPITKYLVTGFLVSQQRFGPRFRGRVPDVVDPQLGAFLGYLLGDGFVNKYRAVLTVAEPEVDILPKLLAIEEDLFGIRPLVFRRLREDRNAPMHDVYLNSSHIASNLQFMRVRRVPDLILRSGNRVVAEFLRWLFEADGTVFSKGRGRRAVGLKAKDIELLRDVQILLLRFGIHSRIVANVLLIRRGEDIVRYAKHIGFVSKKKTGKLNELQEQAMVFGRVHKQRSEKVVAIYQRPPEDVYDIEVPNSHRFVANGLVSHNTAKSEMLKFAAQVAPRGIYASGRGTSAAGLSAAVIREKNVFMLEAGIVVLGDQGIAAIDEFEKMKPEDRTALHEAMEQGTVTIAKGGIYATLNARTAILAACNPVLGRYNPFQNLIENIGTLPIPLLSVGPDEQVLVKCAGIVQSRRIGRFVDSFYSPGEEGYPMYVEPMDIQVASMDENFRVRWQPLKYVFRHKSTADTYRIYFKGRDLVLTGGHSVYTFEDGRLTLKPASKLRQGDFIAISKRLPTEGNLEARYNLLEHVSLEGCFLHNAPVGALRRLAGVPAYQVRGRKLSAKRYGELTDEEMVNVSLSRKGSGFYIPSFVPVNGDLFRLLGYFVAEGSIIFNRAAGVYAVDFSLNAEKDQKIVSDIVSIAKTLFNVEPCLTFYRNSVKVDIRSRVVVEFLTNCFGLKSGAREKRIPDAIFNAPQDLKWEFLKAYYDGDAGVTTSEELASQLLQLFGQLGHVASLFRRAPHEAVIEGRHVKAAASYLVPMPSGKPQSNDGLSFPPLSQVIPILKPLLGAFAPTKSNRRTLTPRYWSELRNAIWVRNKITKLSDVRLRPDTMRNLAGRFGIGEASCYQFVMGMVGQGMIQRERMVNASGHQYQYSLTEKGNRVLDTVGYLDRIVTGDLGFAKVQQVEKLSGTDLPEYVYDLSVPNSENFVADTAICHNTRFDLIFVIKDQPHPAEDEKLATHILSVHTRRTYSSPPPVEFSLLKKYITYSKKISPNLTKEAVARLKDYYLVLRKGGGEEGQIPATPRTLEAMIRVATARARILLREEVTEEDALAAIALMNRMVEDVLTDASTKKTDFGIQLGKPVGETRNLRAAMEVFKSLEGADKKPVERRAFKEELVKSKFSDEDAEKMIRTMFREGMVYESKPGFIRRLGG